MWATAYAIGNVCSHVDVDASRVSERCARCRVALRRVRVGVLYESVLFGVVRSPVCTRLVRCAVLACRRMQWVRTDTSQNVCTSRVFFGLQRVWKRAATRCNENILSLFTFSMFGNRRRWLLPDSVRQANSFVLSADWPIVLAAEHAE